MSKVIERLQQPISLIKDVEPELKVFDLVIGQQQLEETDLDNVDIEELAEDIKQELCMSDPMLRRYLSAKPQLVQLFEYTSDIYPSPLQGPGRGVQVAVCLSKAWSKDWGGEIISFEECEPKDVVASYPGRITVVYNEAWWKISQPNIRAEEPLKYLFFALVN